MSIKRYTASADTTITNAFEAGMTARGTGSNMGYADSLEVFSIYGQLSASIAAADGSTTMAPGLSQELSRILINFPITSINNDRTSARIPALGSVSFYLRMYNAQTPFTLPQNFNLVVAPVSRSWVEGAGLDMDNYKDLENANWMNASTAGWTTVGGDYLTGSNYNVSFAQGYEDLELDITDLVENWIADLSTPDGPGVYNDYGVGVRFTSSQEAFYSCSNDSEALNVFTGSVLNNTGGATQSYYTKKFFARSTEYFFKRPVIEARWDSRIEDDRENFMYSSSFAPLLDNLNTLYFYNYVRGRLTDLPGVGTGVLNVSLYSGSAGIPTGSAILLPAGGNVATALDTNATGGWVSTGIYSCSVSITAAATRVLGMHDLWHSESVQYHTGSFYPELAPTYAGAPTFNRITSCTNLKKSYSKRDKARFRFFVRSKDWSPTLYTVSTANNPTDCITSASYAIYRVVDNFPAVAYGTGSSYSTYLSFDKDGNYFDLDMGLLEPDYMYEIKLSYYNDSIGDWQEQQQTFKFRIEE